MAHELTINQDGQVEFAYLERDGLPWHGLGQAMPEGASIDEWRKQAGMEWRIQRSKVRYAVSRDANVEFEEMSDQHVLFRSDSKKPLGLVSEKYKVVQPSEVIEFFRDIAKAGGLELSAAGTIFGGRRFWATAKIGEASPTSVKDKIGGYLLISTSADGSLATEVRRTTVRTVCQNTLAMAMRDAAASVKVSHKSVFDPMQVKEFMGLNEAAWEAFKHQVVRLANKPVILEAAEATTAELLGGGDKVYATAGYNKILDLFQGEAKGADFDGVNGSAWGYINAVTEYVDWFSRARTHENRFVSSQWGQGADLKQRALDKMLALV
jgi:phage/plasmid-like protein (TIGR03299 family)